MVPRYQVLWPEGRTEIQHELSMLEKFIKLPEQAKDPETGKFLPKQPLELTWPHFWLEVAEIAVGILIAQVIWEVGVLIKEMIWLMLK